MNFAKVIWQWKKPRLRWVTNSGLHSQQEWNKGLISEYLPPYSVSWFTVLKMTRPWRVFRKEVKWSEVAQSCPILCDPMDCSPPGSSIHGIFQARVLEWVAISFSRGSSWPRGWTQVSHIAGRCFTIWATREALSGRKEWSNLAVIARRGCKRERDNVYDLFSKEGVGGSVRAFLLGW